MIHRFCFYGNLRKGGYGYHNLLTKFGMDSVHYMKTISIPGYELYKSVNDVGAICCRSNSKSSVVFDLMHVINEKALEEVMKEEKFNIITHDLVCIGDFFYSIFIYNIKPISAILIKSGDWFKKNLDQNDNDYRKENYGYSEEAYY